MTYDCELSKKWEKEKPEKLLSLCCYCYKFMDEADACLEDSILTPLMIQLGKHKPNSTTFAPNDYAPKEVKRWFLSVNEKAKT